MTRSCLGAVLLALAALPAPPARADTLVVPVDYPTIQSAIDAAGAGDTVLIKAGTYVEPVDIVDKSDVLVRGSGKVVLEASDFNTGITLIFCSNVEVRGITVSNAREHSIVVGCCSDVLVKGCRILGGDGDGIRVFSATGTRLQGNVVKDMQDWGIRVQEQLPSEPGGPGVPCDGPADTLLLANRIEAVGGDGILVAAAGTVLEKNRVVDAGGDGIVTLAEASGTQWIKNRVTGAGARGLVVRGSGEVLEKNRVKAPGGTGLVLEASAAGATLLGNRVVKPGGSGVQLEASGASLHGVRVIEPGAHGYLVSGAGNLFEQCRSSQAWFHGFNVDATSSTFLGCSATGSGMLDLVDAGAGDIANVYEDCKFKTSSLP